MYMLSKQDTQRAFPFLNVSMDIEGSVRRRLGVDEDAFVGRPNDTTEQTSQAMTGHRWLCHPRFEYRGLRTKVSYMSHQGNVCRLYFVMLSLAPTADAAINVRLTRDIISRCGYVVEKAYIVHPNSEYVRQGKIDDMKLWTVTDRFYNGNGNSSKPVLKAADELDVDIDVMLDEFLHFDGTVDDAKAVRSARCTQRSRCPYYEQCFPQEDELPDDTILSLTSSAHKYEMYERGISYLSQADITAIEGSRQQYAQIMADRQGGFFCDRMGLREWMRQNIAEPLSFLDFEWDLYALPPYDGMRPVEVLPFEFALIVRQGGVQRHVEYVGFGDDRREFIEKLLENIPDTGTILAYNALGAESLRLKELGEAFPEYRSRLEKVRQRLVDLSLPFTLGLVYDVRMKGFYSIKTIQNIIDSKHSYHDLQVDNGLEAVRRYRQIDGLADGSERQTTIRELKEYCGLDALSLAIVYDALVKVVENDENTL